VTRSADAARSFGYTSRLYLAFAALTGFALLLAAIGAYLQSEAEYRVLRGRIASDVYMTLQEFSETKADLRNWSYRRILGQTATPEDRAELVRRLARQSSLYASLADRAHALDVSRGKAKSGEDDRAAIRSVLATAVGQLDAETAAVLQAPSGTGVGALARLDRQFDDMVGVDLPTLLRESLASERAALDLERSRADEGLARARRVLIGSAGGAALGSLGLALWLVFRFRQPFRLLEQGLAAYRRGDFAYRFVSFRDREFSALGQQLDAMAAEVAENRLRDARFREELEAAVAARTAELNAALGDLAASEAARRTLLANISHELRTPVTVIRGEAQVALRTPPGHETALRDALDRIVGVSRQMGRLIEDLLVFVRDPQDLARVSCVPVELALALAPSIEIARSLAESRRVTFDAVLPTGLWVLADAGRLGQVVNALLDNALRYSHPGGGVTLNVTVADDAVTVSIRDKGIGIRPEDMDHVFDRGWRSLPAQVHRPDGLGLGLSIALALAQAQSAQLTLAPGQPCGTVATLVLPRAIKEAS
jgi:two-component system, OmpR family, sensor kinase